jgi:hypothetical protein
MAKLVLRGPEQFHDAENFSRRQGPSIRFNKQFQQDRLLNAYYTKPFG